MLNWLLNPPPQELVLNLGATLAALIVTGCASAAITQARVRGQQKAAEALREISEIEAVGVEGLPSLHAELCGFVEGFGEYRLASLDRGRTWWSVDPEGTRITPADPALLAKIRGLDTQGGLDTQAIVFRDGMGDLTEFFSKDTVHRLFSGDTTMSELLDARDPASLAPGASYAPRE